MSIYAITIEADNRMVIDEARAKDEKEALARIKEKYNLDKVRCCIVSLVEEVA